jgi:hypothetical protein
MTKSDLIRRRNSRYLLTLLCKIVYNAHMTIGKALIYCWKLRALESVLTSALVAFIILFIWCLIGALVEPSPSPNSLGK